MAPHPPHELSLTGRRWRWPERPGEAPGELAHPLQVILARRGLTDPAQIDRYLSPSLADLEDPASMADMGPAVERILRAVAAKEPITIYGDYDADGVAATVVLVDFLRQLGARITYYIPDRRAEGYGLNLAAVRELSAHTKLIVTVDCGITAHAEISLANSLGVDVIVVDHHQVPAELPPAVAVLNPHRPDCPFPAKDLCAAGLAFMLAAALRRALRERGAFTAAAEPDLRPLLDVVALATVADMVPLRGANRVLVAAGLRRIASTTRVGLRALMEVSKVQPERITATDLGFRLGPRVNARGRLGRATEAVELLLTHDPNLARELAAGLDAANRARRELEGQTLEAALAQVEAQGLAQQAALVVADPSWHPGVVGLVATRLVSRFHRPAIVIGEGGRGSGRTFEDLDLLGCIEAAAPHLDRFGGHRAAAGVTLKPDAGDSFRAAFAAEVERRLGCPPFVASLDPDLEIDADGLNLQLLTDLQKLEPFGQANPEPLLVSRGLRVRDKRVVGERHLKLRLGETGLDAIGFGLGELVAELPGQVDVVFNLSRNHWQGKTTLQLKVADLRRST